MVTKTDILYMLKTPKGELSLAAIFRTREEAEASLKNEFPKGCLIFPGHMVVPVQIELLQTEIIGMVV